MPASLLPATPYEPHPRTWERRAAGGRCLLRLRFRAMAAVDFPAPVLAAVVTLSLAGLVTYVLYPAAPPWLAAEQEVIEPVDRISSAGWAVFGLPRAGALLDTSQGQVNLVAAVPSLHTAFAVLMCIVLLTTARRSWQRVSLVAYAVLMPLVLVWSGEHYVVDTLLGAAYACAVVLLVPQAGRAVRTGTRRAARAAGRPLPWRA